MVIFILDIINSAFFKVLEITLIKVINQIILEHMLMEKNMDAEFYLEEMEISI